MSIARKRQRNQPNQDFDFKPVKVFQNSDLQNCRTIKLCCLKLLSHLFSSNKKLMHYPPFPPNLMQRRPKITDNIHPDTQHLPQKYPLLIPSLLLFRFLQCKTKRREGEKKEKDQQKLGKKESIIIYYSPQTKI